MSATKISQREARRLRKRVQELEERDRQRLNAWGSEYTAGAIHTLTLRLTEESQGRAWMAKQLDCVFVAKYVGTELNVYAVPKKRT